MRRRTFLQMVAGMFGAASVGVATELLARADEPKTMASVAVAQGGSVRLFYNVGTKNEPKWVQIQDVTSFSAAHWLAVVPVDGVWVHSSGNRV